MKMSLKRGILFTLSFSLAVLSVPVSTFAEEIESADETLQIFITQSSDVNQMLAVKLTG